jgi:hypothetical protein
MKRDMDLIRELLLKLEALPIRPGTIPVLIPGADEFATPGYDVAQIDYNLSQTRRDFVHCRPDRAKTEEKTVLSCYVAGK